MKLLPQSGGSSPSNQFRASNEDMKHLWKGLKRQTGALFLLHWIFWFIGVLVKVLCCSFYNENPAQCSRPEEAEAEECEQKNPETSHGLFQLYLQTEEGEPGCDRHRHGTRMVAYRVVFRHRD